MDDLSKGYDCTACLDTCEETDPFCTLKNCGHRFHKICTYRFMIAAHVAGNLPVRCPLCRNTVDDGDVWALRNFLFPYPFVFVDIPTVLRDMWCIYELLKDDSSDEEDDE